MNTVTSDDCLKKIKTCSHHIKWAQSFTVKSKHWKMTGLTVKSKHWKMSGLTVPYKLNTFEKLSFMCHKY